jgi:hypothetical protein
MFAPSSKLSAPSPRPSIGAADVSPQSTRLGDTPRLPAWHLPSWTDIVGAQDSRLYGAPRCCRNASRRSNLALRASNLACSAFKLAYSFFSAAYCARNLAISRSASSCWSSSGASISPLSQIRARRARALTRPVSIGHRLGSHQKTRLCHKITSVDNSRRIISRSAESKPAVPAVPVGSQFRRASPVPLGPQYAIFGGKALVAQK